MKEWTHNGAVIYISTKKLHKWISLLRHLFKNCQENFIFIHYWSVRTLVPSQTQAQRKKDPADDDSNIYKFCLKHFSVQCRLYQKTIKEQCMPQHILPLLLILTWRWMGNKRNTKYIMCIYTFIPNILGHTFPQLSLEGPHKSLRSFEETLFANIQSRHDMIAHSTKKHLFYQSDHHSSTLITVF